jgi:hypothetical protein
MTLGVEVRPRLARVPKGIPVDTNTLFVAGPANQGSTTEAVLTRSIGDVAAEFGARGTGNTALYDYLDAAFGEGLSRAYVSRRANTDADITTALGRFDEDLGPGQVAAVGEPAGADIFTTLLGHAATYNRVALLDVDMGDDVAAMIALGGVLGGLAAVDYGALFGGWLEIPPPLGVVGGSARQVPASAGIAGLIARVDANGNPNRAAAGRDYPFQYATGFVNPIGKADREALLDAGVNPLASIYGVLENYGFQTAVPQSPDNPYWQFNCSRARMWIIARSRAAGEPFVFRTIDGQGKLANALRGAIDANLLELYGVDGLFGATPGEAFVTTVGGSVNTIDTVAQGELHAVSEVRLSQHAKAVIIDLVTVPVTSAIV